MTSEHRITEQLVVHKPFSKEAKELLTPENGFWICTIEPKSLGQVLLQNAACFGYVVPCERLSNLVLPTAFEVAIPIDSDGRARPIAESNNLLPSGQRTMIEEYDRVIGIPDVKVIIGHASVIAQSVIKYQQQQHRRVKLIDRFCACTPDEVGNDYRYACVTQYDTGQLCIGSWWADERNSRIRVLPVVVPVGLEI